MAFLFKNSFLPADIELKNLMQNKVYYSVVEFYSMEDFKEQIYLNAWSFCETEEDNKNKSVSLIIKNNKDSYIYSSSTLATRNDIVDEYKNLYKIKGVFHGIGWQISTVCVNNGTYDIFLYDYENDASYGLVQIPYQLTKSNDEVIINDWQPQVLNTDNITINAMDEIGDISDITICQDLSISIHGYVDIESNIQGNTQIQPILKINNIDGSSQYITTRISGDNDTTKLKFETTIPSEMAINAIGMQICFQNVKDNLFISQQDTKIGFAPQEVQLDNLSLIDDSKLAEPRFTKIVDTKNGLLISGWSVVLGEDTTNQKVYIQLNYKDNTSIYLETCTVYRPDVSVYLKDDIYDWSGFVVQIPEQYLGTEENPLVTFTSILDTGKATYKQKNIYSAKVRRTE